MLLSREHYYIGQAFPVFFFFTHTFGQNVVLYNTIYYPKTVVVRVICR